MFEERQEVRFENILKTCRDMFEGLQMEVDNLKDDMKKFGDNMKDYELKIVELENGSRRNNLVS